MENFTIRYTKQKKCPGCESSTKDSKCIGDIKSENYLFKEFCVPAHPPAERTSVILCAKCGLFYKDFVPAPEDLSKLFEALVGKAWNKTYSYEDEIKLVREFLGDSKFEILDIGASNGELLKGFSPYCSRLSALDVVKNSECEKHINGEYIIGWLEDEGLSWSRNPYDLVTVFDVVEHFYDVRKAFKALYGLVKPGGYVLIETGDAESALPRRHGVNAWWYLNRVEHHEAFTQRSLSKIAEEHGFDIVQSKKKSHKFLSKISLWKAAILLGMSVSYGLWPNGYMSIMGTLIRKPIIQPRPIFKKDHLLILLKKNVRS